MSRPPSTQPTARERLANSLALNYSQLMEQRPRLQLPPSSVSALKQAAPSYPISEESDAEECAEITSAELFTMFTQALQGLHGRTRLQREGLHRIPSAVAVQQLL